MAEDGAAYKDQEMQQLEDRLREVGERLQTPPDDAEDLLKLLSEVEECLLKVEQSPPESTSNAIQPATESLVKKDLLGHDDPNVRLAVASCISEITRITAPNAPYDDDAMKDVFAVIIGSFQQLDKIDDPFFGRRASILDTVAKVRSCVVMLDLECDDLILDMFHHFVRTVSSEHPEAVRSCMETIMKLVIEESEDVQPQIASCLLENVRKEEKDSSSPSFILAEKVIGSCREKLKPAFQQLLKDTSLSEYSQIVTSVCEEGSDDKEDNNADPGKDTVDDGKLSERTISDELPQEPDKIEQDVSRPEQDGTSMNGTPGNAVSSDAIPAYNGAESVAAKPKKLTAPETDQNKLHPSDKFEATAHADTKKEGPASSVGAANGAADDTSGPAAVTLVKRRGRPPGLKSSEKKAAGKNQSSSDVKKIVEADSAEKLAKQSAKDDVKPSVKKAAEGESSKKHKKISSKQEKNETLSEEDPSKDLSLKEMVSTKSSTKGSGRTKGQSAENSKQSVENSTSKRKREQETEETPQSRKSKGLDGSLVGARIKVWWPDDKAFYKGVVDSFDPISKRHKVAYDDGDVEVLLLRKEKWEFISEEKETPVASDTTRGRKQKGSSAQPPKEEKTETPISGGGNLPKKRGRPKGSGNGTPSNKNSATPSTKGKTESKDVKETPKTGTNITKELEKSSKDKATRSTDEKIKDKLLKDGGDKSESKSKEAGSKDNGSKDEIKSTEGKGRPGRKPKSASTPTESDADKEKQEGKKIKAEEIEQEASANASTGSKGKDSKDEVKSTEGKGRPGRKPKRASTPIESDADKEEEKIIAEEIEQEASANATTGSKGKDSKDEIKSTEGKGRPGRKPQRASTPIESDADKEEEKIIAEEIEQEASANASTGSKGKDSKDEIKSTEGKGRPGRKPKSASTPTQSDADKEKQEEKKIKAEEIEQEVSANASTGSKGKDPKDEIKSTEGKGRPGRKPKRASTPMESDVDKEKKSKADEIEQEASANPSAGKKRRRKS